VSSPPEASPASEILGFLGGGLKNASRVRFLVESDIFYLKS
jgi:hypothetical protein